MEQGETQRGYLYSDPEPLSRDTMLGMGPQNQNDGNTQRESHEREIDPIINTRQSIATVEEEPSHENGTKIGLGEVLGKGQDFIPENEKKDIFFQLGEELKRGVHTMELLNEVERRLDDEDKKLGANKPDIHPISRVEIPMEPVQSPSNALATQKRIEGLSNKIRIALAITLGIILGTAGTGIYRSLSSEDSSNQQPIPAEQTPNFSK